MKPVKKWMKLLLDAVIFVLLMLMYRKQAVSMAFHEIGGLALIVFFVVHHVFNGKWIAAVSNKFFQKGLPIKTRVSYAVDALMLIAFLCIGVSGALISKTVFSFHVRGGAWKTLHYFCAALSLLLLGVHVGLHMTYLFGWMHKRGKFIRIAGVAVALAFVAAGVYSLATTSYFRWLSMPFTSPAMVEPGEKQRGNGDYALPDGVTPPGDAELPDQAHGTDEAKPIGNGNGGGLQLHGNENGVGKGSGASGIGGALTVFFQFAAIASVFAALAYAAEWLCKRRSTRETVLLQHG